MFVLQVFFVILATLMLLVCLILNGLIIKYLKKKGQIFKTGFDLALVDSIWSLIFYIILDFIIVTCSIFPALASCPLAIGLSITQSIFRTHLLATTFNTIFVKFCYLRYSQKMLGTSDQKIYHSSIIGRLIVMGLVIFFNSAKPNPGHPMIYSMILSDPKDCQK